MLAINDYKDRYSDLNVNLKEVNRFIQFLMYKQKEENATDETSYLYYGIYRNHIRRYEKLIEKELALWNDEDVKTCISGSLINNRSTYYALFTVINQYEIWAKDRGYNYSSNPCEDVNLIECMRFNENLMQSKAITIDEIYEMWELIKTKQNEESKKVDVQNLALILLARIGLRGIEWNEILALRPEDLDEENRCINVTNRKRYLKKDEEIETERVVKVIKDVDIRIFNTLKEAYNAKEKWFFDKLKKARGADRFTEEPYDNDGFIIKYVNKLQMTSPVLRKLVKDFFDAADRTYINLTDIYKNFLFDKILEVEKENGIVYTEDVKRIYEEETGQTAYHPLKKLFEEVFKTQVMNKKGTMGSRNKKEYDRQYYLKVLKEKRKKAKEEKDRED